MAGLEKLQGALEYIPACRKDKLRGILRAAPGLDHYMPSEPYLIDAINEMWDLVCDSATTSIKVAIQVEARRMKEAAERALASR